MISHTWLPTGDVVCIQYHKWTRRKIQGLPTRLSSNLMSHCLKFTAVNIPGRQLSLTWPVPIITTGLVHSLARENARSCEVRWSAVLLTGAGAGAFTGRSCMECEKNLTSYQRWLFLSWGWMRDCLETTAGWEYISQGNLITGRQSHGGSCWEWVHSGCETTA